MAATPGNAMNLNSTSSGLTNWDGTATMSTTPMAQYNVVVGASTNTIQNEAPGTAGNVLTSNGASSYPTFQALPYTKMPWTDKAALFTAVSNNGYFCTGTFAVTMPASPAQGDVVAIAVDGAVTVTITGNTGQTLQIGKAKSAAAGTAVNNFTGDTVFFVYRSSDTNWIATQVIGTFTVT